jgi:dimethylargininase
MSRSYGGHSMFGPLRRVLVKSPEPAFAVSDPAAWHYTATPDLAAARKEHEALVDLLRADGAEVLYHDAPQPDRADAVFVFDPALITDRGAIVLRMGKLLRRGEESAMERALEDLGVPILAALAGDARAEGGDLLWVDRSTLAVGQGFRTNAAGLAQLAAALKPLGVSVVPVDLPPHGGPEACLHLLSLISVVDHRLAVVYPELLAASFRDDLRRRGFRLLEVPREEFPTQGPNILALRPGRCVLLEGNPVTERLLRDAGCEVQTYRGQEISMKAEGGPTCLTRPILRAEP